MGNLGSTAWTDTFSRTTRTLPTTAPTLTITSRAHLSHQTKKHTTLKILTPTPITLLQHCGASQVIQLEDVMEVRMPVFRLITGHGKCGMGSGDKIMPNQPRGKMRADLEVFKAIPCACIRDEIKEWIKTYFK